MNVQQLTSRCQLSYGACAPHRRWCGGGSVPLTSRGHRLRIVPGRPGRGVSSAVVGLGCLACLSFLLGCSRRRSVGASGAGTAAVVVAGCPALVVPGPLSQQMSCQRSRVGRRACGPPVWSQMNRSRRQRRDQRKQQSGGSPGAVVGSARGGRGTTTEPSRGPAAWATTAGECGAGCGGADTAAGGGFRRPIAAGPDGYPGREAGARRRQQDRYQRSAFSAGWITGVCSAVSS